MVARPTSEPLWKACTHERIPNMVDNALEGEAEMRSGYAAIVMVAALLEKAEKASENRVPTG